ncbi:MAG: hypothetical protein J5641_01645 [Bacteroidales bacterium]|nr:hypothetical protein [Bacteroidales bacterium]
MIPTKPFTIRLPRVLALVLTFAALMIGQGAMATTKTVTYTMTSHEQSGVNNYEVVFTRSGDAPFDASVNTYTCTFARSSLSTSGGAGNFTLELADDFLLHGSWSEGSNVSFGGNNLVSLSTKGITYTLRCLNPNYYVTHVTMAKEDGTITITNSDYDDELNFSHRYTSAYTQFGQLTITYSDAPHHAPEDILGINYNGDEGYYEIPDADALNALATYVNSGNNCAGLTFMMTADITIPYTTAWNDEGSIENNYTPIGNINTSFSGTFDGGGHTISGIRIYIDGTDASSSYKGIIGSGVNCTVHNVTLADTRITGYSRIGGIVGFKSNGVVSNCHATATVAFHVVKKEANVIGGIVGNNEKLNNTSTVSDCTSAAVFTIADNVDASTCGSFGGIVGLNSYGTISDCTSAGVTLPNLPAAYGGSGAIVGKNSYTSILSGNTYHSCLMGGTYAFNIGAGINYTSSMDYNAGDVSGISLDRNKLFLFDEHDNTALINAYSKTYNSDESTAHSGTRPNVQNLTVTLKGRTLYKDGNWNTLCLPFAISGINSLPSSLKTGVSIMELDNSATGGTGFDATTGTLTLNFKSVTAITRGKPCFIKWTSGEDVVDPIFTSVDGSRMSASTTTVTSSDKYVSLRGTYAPANIYTAEKTRLYLGSSNTLYYPSREDFTLKAFRAYFTLNNGLTAGEPASQQAPVRAFVLNFDEDEATGIATMSDVRSKMSGTRSTDASSMASPRRAACIS